MATRIPEIPHDKSYHFFVCYAKNSLDVVRIIVDNLEKEGLICCYYDRDFIPGRSIMENMYEAIEKSLYMLIVLSDDFEDSHFCKDELDKASHLRAKGEYNLIPIKVEPCSVPESLRHLVYIDVEDCIDTAHIKIIDAMSKKELRLELREDKNGECLEFALQTYKLSKLSLHRYRLKLTEAQKAELWSNQFEVSADLLQEIEDTANASLFVKYIHIFIHPYFAIFIAFLHLLILLMIVFLTLLLTTGREKADSFLPVQYCLAVGVPTWFFFLFTSMISFSIYDGRGFGVISKVYNVLSAKLWKLSQQNITQTGLIFFISFRPDCLPLDSIGFIRFHIMRYNFKPCQVFFEKQLERRHFLKKFCRKNETKEECTSRLFDAYLSQNCAKLTQTSTTHRHKMKTNSRCVCLLVETWLKSKNLATENSDIC